ncbi:MAG TPA: hypothetical protein VG269_26640 [Tepidisphaeraceae bacterium]|jgi:hypothetical protein|nr:hypothetical protein [Tepidisphaeraceae bacterium]
MGRERDPSIERHLREQKQEPKKGLLDGAPAPDRDPIADYFARPEPEIDADDVLPELCETVVVCATHMAGVWKIVGRFRFDPDAIPHTVFRSREFEKIRGLLMARGYRVTSGTLDTERFTGAEMWGRAPAPRHKIGGDELRCPMCRGQLDGASPVDAKQPEPPREGDVTVCVYCAAVLAFDTKLRPQALPAQAVEALPDETQEGLRQAVARVKAIIARKRGDA